MRVLIVSFDKSLAEELKKALAEHEVYVAKNSEEAIKVIPSMVDVVIYDAISGAISEEDINTLYKKKFSDARYIILYDELFPVDENNIVAPKKLLVSRDESPAEIAKKVVEFPVEEPETIADEPETEDIEIEHTYLGVQEESKQEELVPSPSEREVSSQTPGKILVVSFDQTLIDSLKVNLGHEYELIAVKNAKQALEKGKDAQVVVFDAISGMIAEKGLTELSKDADFVNKRYIILVDDLFPINTDNVPLQNKEVLSRDTSPEEIAKLVKEKAGEIAQSVEQAQEEPSQEEIQETVEAEQIPALEALEKVIEQTELEAQEQIQEEDEEEEVPQKEDLNITEEFEEKNIAKELEEKTVQVLSEDMIKDALSRALEDKMEELRAVVEEVVRKEIERIFEELDIKGLIKHATYQALKERLEELIS